MSILQNVFGLMDWQWNQLTGRALVRILFGPILNTYNGKSRASRLMKVMDKDEGTRWALLRSESVLGLKGVRFPLVGLDFRGRANQKFVKQKQRESLLKNEQSSFHE